MTSLTLLIIESSDIIRIRLKEMLTFSFPHFNILSSGNCNEGMATFSSSLPQIVILDLNTCDCNGLKFLPQLLSTNAEAKIIIASSHPTKNYRQASLNAGAYDYVDKSTDIENLFNIIGNITL